MRLPAGTSPLTADELQHLYEIHACPDRIVGVERDRKVCLSYNSATTKIKRANVSLSKIQSLQVFKRALKADTLELTYIDYSFKQVRPIVVFEKPITEQDLLITIPTGPVPNPWT